VQATVAKLQLAHAAVIDGSSTNAAIRGEINRLELLFIDSASDTGDSALGGADAGEGMDNVGDGNEGGAGDGADAERIQEGDGTGALSRLQLEALVNDADEAAIKLAEELEAVQEHLYQSKAEEVRLKTISHEAECELDMSRARAPPPPLPSSSPPHIHAHRAQAQAHTPDVCTVECGC
jgi:hypothetical protein